MSIIRGILLVAFFAGTTANAQRMSSGSWIGRLTLNDSVSLPFVFLNFDSLWMLKDGEDIPFDQIEKKGNAIKAFSALANSTFSATIVGVDSISGTWINHNRKNKNEIPFYAVRNKGLSRTQAAGVGKAPLIRGKWKAVFSEGLPKSYAAIGLLSQAGNSVKGTFHTETGDYRFLKGRYTGKNVFELYGFDGKRPVFFRFLEKDERLEGSFYSGIHHYESWNAIRDSLFELRDPTSISKVKEGMERIQLRYRNTEGRMVSLDDPEYKGKVVLLQIMGTWCPNCLDEIRYFAPRYEELSRQGIRIIAVSFERTDPETPEGYEKARINVARLKDRLKAPYEFLVADLSGTLENLGKAFPSIEAPSSFPTTIYIDRKGKIRKVYSGFPGPATGEYHERWKKETSEFLDSLAAE